MKKQYYDLLPSSLIYKGEVVFIKISKQYNFGENDGCEDYWQVQYIGLDEEDDDDYTSYGLYVFASTLNKASLKMLSKIKLLGLKH